MVELDQANTARELERFNSTSNAWMFGLQLNQSEALRYQAGQLSRTLINLSPPKDRQSSNQRLESFVPSKFALLANPHRAYDSASAGPSGVDWYAFSPVALYGCAPEKDMSDASVDELYKLFPTLTRGGKQRSGKRGRQTVYIAQKILTKNATVKKLVAKLKGNLGRLKAGWAVAWNKCGSPGRSVPGWVLKHASGAKGDADLSKVNDRQSPSITISNWGRGIGELSRKESGLLQRALQLRTQAMQTDLLLYIRGKKNLKDLPPSLRGGGGE